MVHYRKHLWGGFHYVVLSVLRELTVGHIASGRLHVTENVFPDEHFMDTQPPLPGESGSNTGRLAGATTNTDILGTQQERRHKLVHRDAANAATKHMT